MKSVVKIISFGVALAWVNSSVAGTGMGSSAVPVAGTQDSAAPASPRLKMMQAVKPGNASAEHGSVMSHSTPVTESVKDTLPIEWGDGDEHAPVEGARGATDAPEQAGSHSAQ